MHLFCVPFTEIRSNFAQLPYLGMIYGKDYIQ